MYVCMYVCAVVCLLAQNEDISIYITHYIAVLADARLVDGESKSEGRVEINYKGNWGTVCQDKDWSINEANVICRDLGYLRAKATSSFGKGKGEIRLSGVKCKGDEASIALCSHLGWNVHNCDHSQDAGVVCTNGEK